MRSIHALLACVACACGAGAIATTEVVSEDVLAHAGSARLPAGIRIASRGMDCVTTTGATLDTMVDRVGFVLADYPERVLVASAIEEIDVCAVIARTDAIGLAHIGRGRISISLEAVPHFAEVVHHEVFHMLDYERAGAADVERRRTFARDTRPAGFVDTYAATNGVEDRASTFAYLMARSEELCAIARADEVVRAKVTAIWRFVAGIAGDDRFMRRRAPCVDWIG